MLNFLEKQVRVSTNMAIFITINSSDDSHSNLLDNLNKLFRSFAMTLLCKQLIVEVMLFSQGFGTDKKLALDIVLFFVLVNLLKSKLFLATEVAHRISLGLPQGLIISNYLFFKGPGVEPLQRKIIKNLIREKVIQVLIKMCKDPVERTKINEIIDRRIPYFIGSIVIACN